MAISTKILRAVQRLFTLDKDKTGNEGVGRKIFVGTQALGPFCALAVGIMAGAHLKSFFWVGVLAAGAFASFFIPRLKPWIYKSLLCAALGMARITFPYWCQHHAETLFQEPVAAFSGTVVRRTGYLRGFYEGFIVRIKTPQALAGWPVLVYSPTLLVPGDEVTAPLLRLRSVAQKTSPGYCMFLLKEGAYATGTLPKKALINQDYRSSWQEVLYKKYDELVRQSRVHFGSAIGSLVNTLFLGARDPWPDFEVRETFNRWGIAHYLARSGLHIVILMYAWLALLSYLPFHLLVRRFLTLFLALFYYFLTIPSISFTRAVILFLLINSALLFNKKPHTLHVLTVICFLTLLINPFYLFFLDFQLTFALTYSLIGSRYL